jgi:AAA domain/Iron dependent repressor, N-terminal DNA binding domain
MITPDFETDTESSKNEDVIMPWDKALRFGALTSEELSKLSIIPRKMIIGGFCFEGDLGFIFAARGVGKTWLGMFLAKCLALGIKAKRWDVPAARKVLYIDGEMPPADVQARDLLLGIPTGMLTYINHEILFERTGKIINLADPEFQTAVLDWCQETGQEVVFLDNLSTLASGIDENKGMEWESITPFLMKLRRAHITVIFIHHAGRNGQMRGHSKREDPSAWILRLDMPKDSLDESEGAHFISRFTKWRNATKCPAALEWMFRPKVGDGIEITVDDASSIDIFKQLIEQGVNTNKQIAEEMDVTPAAVSKMAKRGCDEDWLKVEKNRYFLTGHGRTYSVHSDP